MKNPYEVLGVASTATLHDIKTAYRKLAKKYHPDLNPGNKENEQKFKEISHAFDLIGTEEARAKYDRGETDEQKQHQYEEFMRNAQSGGGGRFYSDTQGPYSRYSRNFEENVDMDEILSQIFGQSGRARRPRGPRQEIYQMEIDLREAVVGGEKVITLPSGKTLQVKIPAGIEEGKKLKFSGMGVEGGDVLVEIRIRPDERFRQEGKDLHTEVEISFFDAALGGEINVPTIEGNVMMKVPPEVTTGSKLRLKGKGLGKGDKRGNLIVTLKVAMPKHVDPELAKSLKDLSQRFGYHPRSA